MRYRTLIELVCDAANSDDAANIAGEYLRGNVDFGVAMKCKTETCNSHTIKKCVTVSLVAFLVLSPVVLKLAAVSEPGNIGGIASSCFKSTYTVMPALKTKHTADFKKEWEKKKAEAVLDYIKK